LRRRGPLYGPSTSLILTGGGTGGHVVPAIELAKAHRKISTGSLLYVGSPGSLEERLSRQAKIPFEAVPSGGFVGKSLREKGKALAKMLKGIGAALGILRRERPDLVIGTGGYVQIPVVASALLMRIPVVLLEPNQVMGLANRLFQPWVASVVRPDKKGEVGGIPISSEVRGPFPDRDRFAGEVLGVMILGGSQGARALNEKIPDILRLVIASRKDRRVDIIHQSGERWKEGTINRYRDLGMTVTVEGFLPGLSSHFREQALIVARAGAMTVAEISASGTPAIYIPFPFSAGGHQEMNARAMEEKGAGWCWSEAGLDDVGARAKELSQILFEPERLYSAAERAWNCSGAVSAEIWLKSLSAAGNE
jgi:UDP-N-acetylglucosamine--N-acetylmuramyl-(pentapeptide) pyrophosphoryl-undecaprenol N-acetylglucosamine transferase